MAARDALGLAVAALAGSAAFARLVWWVGIEAIAEALHRETGNTAFERLRKVAYHRGRQAQDDLDSVTGVA